MITATFKPSAYQKAIFQHVQNNTNSLAVNAVAGSGKTSTIIESASFLSPVDNNVLLAFNKHIASEVQGRLPRHVRASTFHSMGMATCRQHLGRVKVDKNKYWTIARSLSRSDETFNGLFSSLYPLIQLIDLARNYRVKVSWRAFLTVAESQGVMGVYAYGELDWSKVADLVRQCLQEGVKQATRQGVIDFTDMVWLPVFKRWVEPTVDNLFIDEAQDLNKLQVSFAEQGVSPTGRAIIVGDPHQAIYAFMGAMSDSFFVVKETFDAASLPLSICYRCPASHLDIAREFCPTIEASPDAIAGTVDSISAGSLAFELADRRDALILCRRRSPLLQVCVDLIAADVPAYIRGDNILNDVLRLIAELQKEYGASYSSLLDEADKYLAEKTEQLESVYGKSKAKGLLTKHVETVDALNIVFEAFSSCKNIDSLVSKLKTLFVPKKDSVILSTVHGSKGLEADWVGVLDWEGMPLSHPHMTTEQSRQETNLQLIATTRSKQDLRFIS